MLGDVINVIVIRALAKDKPPLQRMMECYRYDLSMVDSANLAAHGCFGDAYLDRYWVEGGCHPFLVRIQGQLAGRALIDCYAYTRRTGGILDHAEVPTAEGWVADGLHAVRAMAPHMGNCGVANYREAIAFWNAVVVAYTTGNATVFPEGYEEWRSPIL